MSGDLGERITSAVRAASRAGDGLAIAAALNAVEPAELAEFFHIRLADGVVADPLGSGLPASPGAAWGEIVTSAEEALAASDAGRAVVLVRPETTPDDVLGMQASRGVLTTRGGLVSHAAVVARGWGIPAVVGATDVAIDGAQVRIGTTTLHVGDEITIDGTTGQIYAGRLPTSGSTPPPALDTLLTWADTVARGHVQVRVNADTKDDAAYGRELGAQGIGLCRTEHMFLSGERLPVVRRFILAADPASEEAALDELEHAQAADFEELLEAMDGLPVTVRLLDPPLHEFLPDLVELTARHARGELTETECAELTAVRRLHETNPMIGTRGVRLGVVRPGVYEMQVRALCTAAARLFERGMHPHVEIMIPLVVETEELRIARSWVCAVLDELGHPELGSAVVTVGAMIETPRAALVAGALAAHADFFSFGTNDLTQMTYAFSRDDVESRLLPAYQALGILDANPFSVLDQEGVGELVRIGCEGARQAKPSIKLGVCGEHAGDPESAAFLVRLGVDSVSCSPFRVPMARLGVAQALLECGRVRINEVDFPPVDDADGTADDDAADAPSGAAKNGSGTGEATGTIGVIDETLVLHVLRVRGFVTSDGFDESLGQHPVEHLDALVAAGHVRFLEARGMYSLTPSGKEHHAAAVATATSDDVRAGLAAVYPRFLELNDRFKALCTEWQLRDDAPNDHADADYDRACIEQLLTLEADSHDVVADLARVLPRLGRYRERLQQAASGVAAGDTAKFTGVMCGSFHDIWMELHEDLIVLQDIDRVAEGSF